MIDLSKIVTLSSNDVSTALVGFFSIGPVLAVIAAVIALQVGRRLMRTLRSIVARDGGGEYWQDPLVGWGVGEYNDEVFATASGTGYDTWQGDTGRIRVDGDTFWYSTDADSPYLTPAR